MSVEGFVFVDLETSGLDPQDDSILELGLALYSPTLEPVERWSTLIVTSDTPRRLEQMRTESRFEFVQAMHTKNGLIADLTEAIAEAGTANLPDTLRAYEDQAITLMTKWGVDRNTPLCGSSLRLDRGFLNSQMLTLDSMFSYRIIDASSTWQFELVRRPARAEALTEQAKAMRQDAHRVLADIHNSANVLRLFDGLEPIPYAA
jgi:oligoribonuclease